MSRAIVLLPLRAVTVVPLILAPSFHDGFVGMQSVDVHDRSSRNNETPGREEGEKRVDSEIGLHFEVVKQNSTTVGGLRV